MLPINNRKVWKKCANADWKNTPPFQLSAPGVMWESGPLEEEAGEGGMFEESV